MEINYKGQSYSLRSNDEEIEITTVDADRPKDNKEDAKKLEHYAFAIGIVSHHRKVVKSVRLNGVKLDELKKNSLYGVKENKGGAIKIDVYKQYPCNVYDTIRKKAINYVLKTAGEEVELVNIVPHGFEERDVTIIDDRTQQPISEDEKKKLEVDVFFERELNKALVTFLMPNYPITVNHIYKESEEKGITIDLDEIKENVFSCPRNFSYVKSSESIYYLPNNDIRFGENEKFDLVLLTKEKAEYDLILNEEGDKYIGDPIISEEKADEKEFYKMVYSGLDAAKVEDIRIIKK